MNKDELDPLVDEVINYVLIKKEVDKDQIIKKFNIGYNRAIRIIDQMEELKIISKNDVYGNWDILISNTVKFLEPIKANNETVVIESVKLNNSKNWVTELLLFFGILGAMILVYISLSSDNKKEIDYCSDSILAYKYSNGLIAEKLKSPTSAKFPSYSNINIRLINRCEFEIDGYVDAQNSFGAMIRTKYRANIKFDNKTESYHLEKLNM
ncbi:hypothetical protein VYJ29_004105 [Yersinia enterocolitica]|nr:hypothetical protein [Yersinia enterocolitica]ELI7916205.1 hypothetical protein [Yersinia enterocolitica]ELI7928865.1 hypothetical protein [Yersinia enterocolitica]ELI7961078.1 hypothetical protein [Yersinia enterocolitica]ELI8142473.1 hypothetical protein [Yersinia enterocolitica]